MKYTDHFATKTENYLQFRPDYPAELFSYLANLTPQHDLVWDCGTGNGQAARALAKYFKKVIATDLNQTQLDVAEKKENIEYRCFPAEKTDIEIASVDLITVAQALHWFQFDAFYQEVKRVLKPNGMLAVWCYSLGKLTPALDLVIKKLYLEILGDEYWPKERRYIDEAYQTIPFPFQKMTTPEFYIEKPMNFMQLVGYLNTWSALKEYQNRNQKNPLDMVYEELKKAWGDPEQKHTFCCPIHLLVGKNGS